MSLVQVMLISLLVLILKTSQCWLYRSCTSWYARQQVFVKCPCNQPLCDTIGGKDTARFCFIWFVAECVLTLCPGLFFIKQWCYENLVASLFNKSIGHGNNRANQERYLKVNQILIISTITNQEWNHVTRLKALRGGGRGVVTVKATCKATMLAVVFRGFFPNGQGNTQANIVNTWIWSRFI